MRASCRVIGRLFTHVFTDTNIAQLQIINRVSGIPLIIHEAQKPLGERVVGVCLSVCVCKMGVTTK